MLRLCRSGILFIFLLATSLPAVAAEPPNVEVDLNIQPRKVLNDIWVRFGPSSAIYDHLDVPPNRLFRSLWFDLEAAPEIYAFNHDPVAKLRGYLRLVSLAKMEAISGQRVFLSGPHGIDGIRMGTKDFGHYNPEFVRWITNQAIPGVDDTVFRDKTRRLYAEHLQGLARGFYRTYYETKNSDQYVEQSKTGELQSTEYFCTDWWLRRNLDGSADAFLALFEKLLATYDEEYYLTEKPKMLLLSLPGRLKQAVQTGVTLPEPQTLATKERND